MSTRAQKSRNRVAKLRTQPVNSEAVWDDTMAIDTNSVFVPVLDVTETLERLNFEIEKARLDKLDHQFLDGGILVRFRRKRDADIFRQMLK